MEQNLVNRIEKKYLMPVFNSFVMFLIFHLVHGTNFGEKNLEN